MKHGDSATNQTSQLFLSHNSTQSTKTTQRNKETQMQAIQGNNTAPGVLLIKRTQTKMVRHNKQRVKERKILEMN